MSSSKEAFENIRDLIKANYPLIYAITTEYNRTMQYIRNISNRLDFKFYTWDCVTGLFEHERKEDSGYLMKGVSGNDDYNGFLDNIIKSIEPQGSPDEKAIYLVARFTSSI